MTNHYQKKGRRGKAERPIGNPTTVLSNVCASGKRRYPSEARAELARRNINAHGRGVELRGAYECQGGAGYESCGGWHNTSREQRPEQ